MLKGSKCTGDVFYYYELFVACQLVLTLHDWAAIMIALTCGMRLGKICGLEWQDIRFITSL